MAVGSTHLSSDLSSASSGLQATFELCRRLGMRLSQQRRMVLDLLYEHVHNCGLDLPKETVGHRRPRTVFISVEDEQQAEQAVHSPGP